MENKITWEQLPKEIQERMLDCQVEQGNPRDAKVFKKDVSSTKCLKGFDWEDTREYVDFWVEILIDGNIDHFYTVHQKQPKFQPIAMKCTQEQWSQLYPELIKLEDVEVGNIGDFIHFPYIVNNYDGINMYVNNILSSEKGSRGRTVHGTFDKDIFLNSFGVKVEEKNVNPIQELMDLYLKNNPERVLAIEEKVNNFMEQFKPTSKLPEIPYGELICKEMEVSNDGSMWEKEFVVFGMKENTHVAAICKEGFIEIYPYSREIDPQRNELEAEIKELKKMIAERQEKVNKLKGE